MRTRYKGYVYAIDIDRVGDDWCAIGRVGHFAGATFVSTVEVRKCSGGSALTLTLALEQELREMIDARG